MKQKILGLYNHIDEVIIMSTGSIEDFSDKISEIGPLYPFAGWEMIFVFFGFAFWIGWHIWQFKIETREYKEEMEKNINNKILERVFKREVKDPGI